MIEENLHEVLRSIEESRAKRTIADAKEPVRLVAVTKNHGVAEMREAIAHGVTDIGENRIQEARKKFETLERTAVWHLIGHLQKNKAKYAVKLFDLIHSVDTLELAEALDKEAGKIGKRQDVLVQVNLAKEASKSGIYEEDLQPLLEAVDALPHLRLRGLMCIAPNYDEVEETRPLFRCMYEIFQRTKEFPWKTANINYLSMGMTHDYRIAVEEGANIVRVGTAIFGPRQY
ncbi:YggS family pyridoxal phosphate-dependent enzyme [Selenomonas sputigena]|uniref:YggS family pyridoxal phosphate-dependent enzyme n=1 Tax=Selenomonas sputigena TaxID=69823 RepID=UPI0022343294|nr:YggS family pyridoxal phosphate-dependent enzyme [Selenomonas sputigena]UZE46468.1 YggS family pyridoxal phosphate-dependent enzyme [Selenomonas sputigena]